MAALPHPGALLVLAQAAPPPPPPAGGSGGGGSGNFLVTPSIGLMIWTLLAFFITMAILKRVAFPRIQNALDRRQRAIEDSIDAAERTRTEADKLLDEYRERLSDARTQAEEIVARARKAGEHAEREGEEAGKARRDELMEQAKRDIETETRRAIHQIRNEVADLTVLATEKVTRKSLTDEDQKRLVEEALEELDFSALSANDGRDE